MSKIPTVDIGKYVVFQIVKPDGSYRFVVAPKETEDEYIELGEGEEIDTHCDISDLFFNCLEVEVLL